MVLLLCRRFSGDRHAGSSRRRMYTGGSICAARGCACEGFMNVWVHSGLRSVVL